MVAEDPRRVHVHLRVVEVLDEIAAARDVEDLKAAADAEQRQPPLQRRAAERDLEIVASAARVGGAGIRGRAVARRVEVGTAAEQEPVDPVEDRSRVGGSARAGGQQQRHPSRLVDAI